MTVDWTYIFRALIKMGAGKFNSISSPVVHRDKATVDDKWHYQSVHYAITWSKKGILSQHLFL